MLQKIAKIVLTRWDTPWYSPVMPGQRATNKKQFTAAFTKDELAAIDAAAARLGVTRTEFLRRAAMRQVQLETQKKESK